MIEEPVGRVISVEPSRDMSTEGRYAVVHGEHRFYPVHEDPKQRERFLDFFGGLELGQKVSVVEMVGRPELLEGLIGAHLSNMETLLDRQLAMWIEDNERLVQYRTGYLARADGEQGKLAGDESLWFKDGFRDRLVEELHDSSLRLEEFGDYEAHLAQLQEGSRHLPEGSIKLARLQACPYLTILKAPDQGGQPDWVREAWEGVSIPIPSLKDGSKQQPAIHARADAPDCPAREARPVLEVRVDEAILALMADGKRPAATWWMDHYETYYRSVLQFPVEDCGVHDFRAKAA